MTLRVPRTSNVPRESLLGRRGDDDSSLLLTAKVAGVLPADDPDAEFSPLAPGIQKPLNVFVNLEWLQQQLGEKGGKVAIIEGRAGVASGEARKKGAKVPKKKAA